MSLLGLDSTAPIQTGAYLPPVFEGRPSSQITTTPPDEVRRMRKVSRSFYIGLGLIFFGIATLVPSFFFWPVGIFTTISVFVAIDYLKKWRGGNVEAESGNVKKANCPSCNRILNFWVATAFPCPFCKRTLMRQGENLYDISK